MIDLIKQKLNEKGFVTGNIVKNNGLVLTSVGFPKKEGIVTSPIVYIENFIKGYRSEEIQVDKVVEEIAAALNKHKEDSVIDSNILLDFNNAKENIVFSLINRERNSKAMETYPYREHLDLLIIYKILIYKNEKMFGTATVTNELLNSWNKSESDLFNYALINTPKLLPGKITNFLVEEVESINNGFYAITNKELMGSSIVLYPGYLKEISNGRDLYLVPSSTHEWMALRADPKVKQSLISTIKEVNLTLNEEEFLSNNLYIYKANENKLNIVNTEQN